MGQGYKQLKLEERERIAVLRSFGKSMREIAWDLGRNHSTISRELKKNSCVIAKRKCYLVHRAEMRSRRRKALRGKRPRLKNSQIREYVVQKLKEHWSPEQIAGRLSLDHPEFKISYKTIYEFVYEEAMELVACLPRRHKRRRIRLGYQRPKQLLIPSRIWISERPRTASERLEFGHWEADSMVSKQSSTSVHVLLERKSRYARISKILRNNSLYVKQTILRRLQVLPEALRRSITYDNGRENFEHLQINQELKTRSYFCYPYHSWEKGSVENTIGLIRRFIPKKTNLERIPSGELFRIQNLLNNRPRKCLNYKTPKEVFKSLDGALAGLI